MIPALQRQVIALEDHYPIVVHRCGDWDYRRLYADR
jgi:hypothetical protein